MSGFMDWTIPEGIIQSDNLDAMNKYIMGAKILNKEAGALRDDWLKWWEELGWYDKNVLTDTFDVARNRKHAFDLANTKNAKEKAAVAEQIKTAFTTEEARGQVKRSTIEGNFLVDPPKPEEKEPFVPLRIKVAGGIILLAVGALWGVKKVYVDPFLRLAKLG